MYYYLIIHHTTTALKIIALKFDGNVPTYHLNITVAG